MWFQGDDGLHYKEPILGNDYWRLWVDEYDDCYFHLALVGQNVKIRNRLAAAMVLNWVSLLYSSGRREIIDGKIWKRWKGKLFNVFPVRYMISNKNMDKDLTSGVTFHKWCDYDMIMKLWFGKIYNNLISKSNQIWHIRKMIRNQLGINDIKELEKRKMYLIGKKIPEYDDILLGGNLVEMFGVPNLCENSPNI